MPRKKRAVRRCVAEDNEDSSTSDENDNASSTSQLAGTVMGLARERVAREFWEACGNDRKKRRIIEELSENVLGHKLNFQGGDTLSEEEDEKKELEREEDEEESAAVRDEGSATENDDGIDGVFEYPYSEDENAEQGEKAFDDFKELLKPQTMNLLQSHRRHGALQPTKKSIKLLGEENARAMLLAARHIHESGLVWSPEWLTGTIRDTSVGNIDKQKLLMCLDVERIWHANTDILGKIIRNIGTSKIIQEALKDFGVAEQFSRLANFKHVPFRYIYENKRQCQQWEIFAARAYGCINALKPDKIDDHLGEKLIASLEKMDDNLVLQTVTGSARNDKETARKDKEAVKPGDRRIEKIDWVTHEVRGVYNNAEEAAASVKGNKFSQKHLPWSITRVLKQIDHAAGDCFWRYEGESRVPPLKSNEEAVDLDSRIEKIDPETHKVLGVYKNPEEAVASITSIKVDKRYLRYSIINTLQKRQKTAGGCFWRYERESRVPPLKSGNKKEPPVRLEGKKKAVVESDSDGSSILSDRAPISGRIETDSDDNSIKRADKSRKEKKRNAQSEPADTSNDGSDSALDSTEEDEDWPYDDDENYEEDEKTFDDFKALLKPDEGEATASRRRGTQRLQPSKAAVKVFGEEHAIPIVTAYRLISKSGVIYSPEWQDGIIRDTNVGRLEKSMLLMCLPEARFATSHKDVLAKLIERIDTRKTVKAALNAWEVKELFPKLESSETPYQYVGVKKKLCQLCELFVARSYVCMLSLGVKSFEGDLAQKVMSCLDKMERYVLTGTPKRWKKNEVETSKKSAAKVAEILSNSAKKARRELTGSTMSQLEKKKGAKRKRAPGKNEDQISKQTKLSNGDIEKNAPAKAKSVAPSSTKTSKWTKKLAKMSVGGSNASRSKGDSKQPSEREEGERNGKKKQTPSPQKAPGVDKDSGTGESKNRIKDKATEKVSSEKTNNNHDTGKEATTEEYTTTSTVESKVDEIASSTTKPPATPTPFNLNTNVTELGAPMLRAIVGMVKIEESPYLESASAEVGEAMFDNFKELLEPKESTRRTVEATDEAVKLFGKALAKALVLASTRIAVSGMLYGSEWRDGYIRGQSCGFVPKPMLLLCLQESRLGTTMDDGMLSKIIGDLNLFTIMKEATTEWKLNEKYPSISSLSSAVAITRKRPSVMKCIVFVARTYRCMKALRRRQIDDSVMNKVEACLSIICSNLRQKKKPQNRQQEKPPPYKVHPYEKPVPKKLVVLPLTLESSDEESGAPRSGGFAHHLFQKKAKPTNRDVPQSKSTISESSSRFTIIPRKPIPMPKKIAATPQGTLELFAGQAQKPKPVTAKKKAKKLPPPPDENTTGPWYPPDASEAILNSIERELAWLIEESIYSLRITNREIQWDFVWQYASASLKIELRKLPENAQNRLGKLVRMDNRVVKTRFEVVRKEIQKKLKRGFLRPIMSKIVPPLRLDSRLQLLGKTIVIS